MIILPSSQILDELKEFSPRGQTRPSDAKVCAPEEVWLRDEFAPWCAANHPPYQSGKRNCTKLVRWALVAADDALCENQGILDCGPAMYRADVLLPASGLNGILPQNGIRSHSTLLVRTAQGWRWFEEQNGRIEIAEDWIWTPDALEFVLDYVWL